MFQPHHECDPIELQGGDPFVKSAIYVRYDHYYKLLNIIIS